MTTDTVPKTSKSEAELELGTATVVGIAKGSGMISPNMATMLAMDGFKHLFGTKAAPVRWLRNAGLNVFDAATPLKNMVIRSAMGL